MRRIIPSFLIAIFVCLLGVRDLRAQQSLPSQRTCGNEISYQQLVATGGDFAARYQRLERFTQQYIRNLRQGNREGAGPDGARASSIVIPVVVHVLWHDSIENISDAQIDNQIEILNRDYRNLNTESVPAEFAGVRSDLQIQFRRAVRDPNCQATTGIERRNTAVTEFSSPATPVQGQQLAYNPVKSFAAGGLDAWPSDRYFNIWVCKLPSGLFGYSSFPTYPANVDGVVIDYRSFGSTGTGTTNPDVAGGRTLVHETGHWLNLFHNFQPDGLALGCFGTSAADCDTSGDRVCDTPPQNLSTPLGACPAATRNTCTETPDDHHDMWQDFMDYSSDYCYAMFTSGQKERIDATIYGARSSLLASDALIPVASGGAADLWSQDKPDDPGAEPNVISDPMYISEDIWVRNASGTADQQHQNPISNTANHVYVRVRNRVCGSTGSATVRLFWAKASPSLSWPAPWDGTLAGPPAMGGEIGALPVTVSGATAQLVDFTWNTPNLADYAAMGAEAGHFCLLARIETAAGPDFGLANPAGTGELWNYAKNNNNIVWKNVELVDSPPSGGREAALVIGDMQPQGTWTYRLVFTSLPDDHGVAFTDVGKIKVNLGKDLFGLWEKGGKQGEGVAATAEDFTLEIQKSGAWIGGLVFAPDKKLATLHVAFDFVRHVPWGSHKLFHVKVEQFGKDTHGNERRFGGQDLTVRNPKTSADELQASVVPAGIPGVGKLWWWLLILLILLLLILLFWRWWSKKP